jgi:U3 small nucleolar RNA-associated protein 13
MQTFEGHSNSVLRVDFITRGMQLVSCASDGLVKVWNVKDEECATTLDGHDEKVSSCHLCSSDSPGPDVNDDNA